MRVPRELRPIVKQLKSQGWEVLPAKGRRNMHLRFLSPSPDVRPLYFSSSPSDHRAIANFKAELKRNGAKVE